MNKKQRNKIPQLGDFTQKQPKNKIIKKDNKQALFVDCGGLRIEIYKKITGKAQRLKNQYYWQ